MQKIGRYLRHAFTREHWFIAYRSTAVRSAQFRFIASPRGHFYADPFLYCHNGKTFLFAEDYRFAERKAVISVAELKENGECGAWHECLARPYHLSYPCVFSWQSQIYMLPETHANRTIEIYRAEEFPLRWQLEKVLISDIDASDATVFPAHGRWWMFATTADGAHSTNDNLHLFHAESPLGPWQPHPKNPVITGKECSRPAGKILEKDGVFIRPAQDCALRYGHRVVFHRIDELTLEDYRESVIGSIEPEWLEGNLGTHTYQMEAGFEAVDARIRVLRGPLRHELDLRQEPWLFGEPWMRK